MGGGHLFFVQNFHYKKMITIFAQPMRGWGRTEVGQKSDGSQTKVGQKSDGVGTMRETMIFANIF